MTSCVYLTIYRGPNLPPFYIGSTTVDKVKLGYHGSVSSRKYRNIWKSELKSNPERFTTKIVKEYSTRKQATEAERKLQIALKVVKSPLYANQAVAAPNGYCGADFKGANSPKFGKPVSKGTRAKISAAKKGIKTGPNSAKGLAGKKNGMFGKKRTEEERIKMSIAHSNRSKEDNIKSYSRKKGLAELNKLREAGKKRVGANNPMARRWKITAPNGEIIMLKGNFKAWCMENELPSSSPALLLNGQQMTIGKWAGWSVVRL
jgi:hypothetical protein